MMLEGILLGILVGKIRGGKFKRLGTTMLRFSWFILLTFILRLGIDIMISLGYPLVIEYRMILYVIAYSLLFIALFLNMHFKCMWFIMLGSIANFAAIILNSGSMPVDMRVLETVGFQNMMNSIQLGTLPQYIPLEEAKLYTEYLGRRLSMPSFYPLKQVFSGGDILIVIGIFFLIQNMMTPSIYHRTSKVIRFDHKSKALK
ncbi:DUF5317 domain-containing protein [Natronincola ferrireducens]|uniref:DUF5317 domain-containing protein n=1 Tax=Natronincola ferrireducens TaxID=393762 RepID=A0A1G8XR84_9FIRM|nr:DUF5317 domain-containing protein [Natronincola ferrireducens]SDJ92987.1 hypothetical protein SAMN05660472_00302 [Natronincola ferrireducens]